MADQPSGKRMVAGILAILLGGLGAHKFYLGYTTTGVIQLIVSVCTAGIGHIIGVIEGIIYLTKSDEEFDRTYVEGKKEWF
jgi:TM2 domain-containing membrane protein YozV